MKLKMKTKIAIFSMLISEFINGRINKGNPGINAWIAS